jgi:hypothetical protein
MLEIQSEFISRTIAKMVVVVVVLFILHTYKVNLQPHTLDGEI